jgi:hypothetical protein
VVIAEGKVIEEGNCFSNKELITRNFKILRNVNFEIASVSFKIGNGVPFYKEMLEGLESDLPPQLAIEIWWVKRELTNL